MRSPETSVAALIVVAALLCPGARGADSPQLEPLETPVLDGMNADVQEELRTRLSELRERLELSEPPGTELAQDFGDLGGLYFLYGLLTHSGPALRNAMALDGSDFRWPYLLAFTYQSEGRLEEAAEFFETALALEPGYLAALVRLGNLRLEQHRLDDSRQLYERALDVSGSTAAALYGIGRVAAEHGDAEAAARSFEQALTLQPGASAIHYPLAQAYRQLGNEEKVRHHLAEYGSQQVAIPDPVTQRLRGLATGSAVSFVRGQRALAAGDLTAAVDYFRAAKTADPESAPVRRALGLTLRRRGDLDGAAAEYRGAIEIEPANPLNYQDLALALIDAGRFRDAEVHFRRATELDEEFAEAYLGLGIALSRQDRPKEAITSLDRALELDPLSGAARFERAMVLTRLDESDRARRDLENLLEAEPEHLSARINLARLLELGGDLAQAEEQARRALSLSPPTPSEARLRLLLGRIAERRGDLEGAADEYRRVLEIAPDLAPASLRLASVQARAGDLAAAVDTYERVLRIAPAHHAARLARASGLILAGRDRDARATLEAGLRIDSDNPAFSAELAVLLAGSPDESARDPEAALSHARTAFRALNDAFSGQVLALAMAANGRFEEAARAQARILSSLERGGSPVSDASRSRLESFRAGISPVAPWLDDTVLLAPTVLPLGTESHVE